MKILVFDDSELHRKAARALLKGHDLTIVGTYDEAEKALSVQTDYDKACELTEAKVGKWDNNWDQARKDEYNVIEKATRKEATPHPDFDAVLTDLLVPASSKNQGSKSGPLVGQEMPLGTIIALRALAVGIKLVAVVTDANHHAHPASAALDGFRPFSVGAAKIVCTNDNVTTNIDEETGEEVSYQFLGSDEGKKKYHQRPDYSHDGIYVGKAWNRILAQLLGENVTE